MPEKPIVPPLLTCPECTSRQDIRTVVFDTFNKKLSEIENKDLGMLGNCKLGTLNNLNLCEYLKIDIPLRANLCNVIITVKNLQGLGKIRITKLEYDMTPQGAFVFDIELYVGQLTGSLLSEVKKPCRFETPTNLVINCKEGKNQLVIGSPEKPIKVSIHLTLPISCDKNEKPKSEITVDLQYLSIRCGGALGLLPDWLTSAILAKLTTVITKGIKDMVELKLSETTNMLRSSIPWCKSL